MNKHSLRTKLALKIAPWLKPGEPRAREWKISGAPVRTPTEAMIDRYLDRRDEKILGKETFARLKRPTFSAPSEVTWKGSWADRAMR